MIRAGIFGAVLLIASAAPAQVIDENGVFAPKAVGGGGPTWAWKRGNGNYSSSTSLTVAVTIAGMQAGGDRVVICAFDTNSVNSGTAITITDNNGTNTYTPISSLLTGTASNGNFYTMQMFLSSAFTTTGSRTFTVTFTGVGTTSVWKVAAVDEYSGLTAGDTSAGTQGNAAHSSAGGTDTELTGTITPGNVNDLLYACLDDLSATSTPGTGFTGRQTASTGAVSEEKAVTSATSQTATFTNAAASYYLAIGAAIQ